MTKTNITLSVLGLLINFGYYAMIRRLYEIFGWELYMIFFASCLICHIIFSTVLIIALYKLKND